MYFILHYCWATSLGKLYFFSSNYCGVLQAQMQHVLQDGWSMFDRPFLHITGYWLPSKLYGWRKKWMRVQFISGDTERTASEQCCVKRASHACIKQRWKSPKLNSQLSFEKLVGIIRGFSGKCDNGNLDWIIVEISTPFGRQMRRKPSRDTIEVQRLPLLFWGNNGCVALWQRGHFLSETNNIQYQKLPGWQYQGHSIFDVQLNLYSLVWLSWYVLVSMQEWCHVTYLVQNPSFPATLILRLENVIIFLIKLNSILTELASYVLV